MLTALKPSDVELLRAALWDGDDAIEAFQKWRTLFDFEGEHDQAQFRLLPLLHDNMVRLDLKDPVLPRLRGIKRYSWCQAQQRNRVARDTIQILNDANIPVLMTKGMALANEYYENIALRPMEDIDLVVTQEDVLKTINILDASGWSHNRQALKSPSYRRTAYLAYHRAINLEKENATGIDLHWRPFHESDQRALADAFWARSKAIDIDGAAVRVPSPTDQLFHTIIHGMRPNVFNSMRWIADAAVVLRKADGQIDWATLFNLARASHTSQQVLTGLEMLLTFVDYDAGPEVLQPRFSLIEWMEQAAYSEFGRTGIYSTKVHKLRGAASKIRFLTGSEVKHLPAVARSWLDSKTL